jgi:hypothetical protein
LRPRVFEAAKPVISASTEKNLDSGRSRFVGHPQPYHESVGVGKGPAPNCEL